MASVTVTAQFQGTINVPLFSAGFTVPSNGGSNPRLYWRGNANGPTPFWDQISYVGVGNNQPTQFYNRLYNGHVQYLSYNGVVDTPIGGGYSAPSGSITLGNGGAIFDGYYQAPWGDLPAWDSIGTQAGTGPYNFGLTQYSLTGANQNAQPFGWPASIRQTALQWPTGNNINVNRTANQNANTNIVMPCSAEVFQTSFNNPTQNIDTGYQANVGLCLFASNGSSVYGGFICPSLNQNYTNSTGVPPFYGSYNASNMAQAQYLNSGMMVKKPRTGLNYLWGVPLAGTSITFRTFSLATAVGGLELAFTGDLWGGSPVDSVLQFDNASLNSQVAAGAFKIIPAYNNTVLIFSTSNQDYVISPDGTQYWAINYQPQVAGVNVSHVNGYGYFGVQNIKFIDANGVFWFTGGEYANGGSSGNITPLVSLGATLNIPTVNIPAFPPLQMPCWADCLAQGSVMAKQTKWDV